MSGTNSDSDGAPDFSFLGDDAAPDADSSFDFTQPAEINHKHPPAESPPESKSKPETQKLASRAPVTKNPAAPVPARSTPARKKREQKSAADDSQSENAHQSPNLADADSVPRRTFNMLLAYAAALTLFFVFLLLTGRLSGAHQLESLPDIRPLQKDEFQLVPESASLPRNHSMQIGESQRFGDVIVTAERITLEPLHFEHMTTGKEATDMMTTPVLKLWLRMENASPDVAFPPWDIGLMCHRSQRGTEISTDENSVTNSWLMISDNGQDGGKKVLNFLHPRESSFNLVDQNSGKVIAPGESLTTYVASSFSVPELTNSSRNCTWRIQIRKGVNQSSGHAVTTLVDFSFTSDQVVDVGGV